MTFNRMNPRKRIVVSFILGAAVGMALVHAFKTQKTALSESELARINRHMMEGSFPALHTPKWRAQQAMQLWRNRDNEAKIATICSEAFVAYLSASKAAIERGDMYFMVADIEKDRNEIKKFIAETPQFASVATE
jgi:hypothetical protein